MHLRKSASIHFIKFFLNCFTILLNTSQLNAQEAKLMLPIGHTDDIVYSQFLNQDKQLLAADRSGSVKLWDINSRLVLKNIHVAKGGMVDIKSIEKGKYFFFCEKESNTLKLWETSTGKCIDSVELNEKAVYTFYKKNKLPKKYEITAFEVNEKGNLLALVVNYFFVQLYELKSKKFITTYQPHQTTIENIKITQSGRLVFTSTPENDLISYDIPSRKLKYLGRSNYPIKSLQTSGDENILLIELNKSFPIVWLIDQNKSFNGNTPTYNCYSKIDPRAGKFFITCTELGKVNVCLTDSLFCSEEITLPQHLEGLTISPSGKRVGFFNDSIVWVYEITSDKKLAKIAEFYTGEMFCNEIKFENDQLLIAYTEEEILLLNPDREKENYKKLRSQVTGFGDVSFSRENEAIHLVDNHTNNVISFSLKNLNFSQAYVQTCPTNQVLLTKNNYRLILKHPLGLFSSHLLSKKDSSTSFRIEGYDNQSILSIFTATGYQGKLLALMMKDSTFRIVSSSTGEKNQSIIPRNLNSTFKKGNNTWVPVDFHFAKNDSFLFFSSNIFNFQKKNNDSILLSYSFIYNINTASFDSIFITTGQFWENPGFVKYYIQKLSGSAFPNNSSLAKTIDEKKLENGALSNTGSYFISKSGENQTSLSSWSVFDGNLKSELVGGDASISDFYLDNSDSLLITSDENLFSILWDYKNARQIGRFANTEFGQIFFLPSNYFSGTRGAEKLIYYVLGNRILTFDQLDIKYNRPDKVLEAIGSTDTALIRSYRQAYLKRIKKLGIDTSSFKEGFTIPEADFTNREQLAFEQSVRTIRVHINGNSTVNLDRFNIWVNEVPVFGQKGISLRNRLINKLDTTLSIILSAGENQIETSVTDINGIESYRQPMYVKYNPEKPVKSNTYFIGIGINRFADSRNNLSWSVKDIRDLSQYFAANGAIIDTLFDEQVNRPNILNLKKRLAETTEEDKVIIAYSGHGLLSRDFDYYLSTHTVNFNKPEENGLPYDELEGLMDGIRARKKLMLIDACHSGEVDKEEIARYETATDSLQIKGTRGGKPRLNSGSSLGMKNSFELMQELFVNVGRSTGATVISAAGGTQFAQERGDLKNGVFSFVLLELLKKNKTVSISDLKNTVLKLVPELTNGLQKPTFRSETQRFDWSL